MLSVDASLSASLNRAAREQALTLNTVMQTAWGILLGRLSGRDDVVFGVTVAGRPAELAGVEHMVGLFINTLPLRLRLPPELPLSTLLRQTQDSQSRLMAHQHLGLAEIQQAAGVGDLFDTLLVFENYPVDRAGLAAAGLGTTGNGLKLGQVHGRDATHYPLALIVQPGETLQLRLDYRPDLFERARRRGHRPPSHPALGGRGCGRRPAAGQPANPGDGRARHHPADLERHDAAGSARDPAGVVRRAGCAHAGRGRGGVRGPHAQLRGARRPCQPAGASSAKPRRRPRDHGGAVRRALARDGDRARWHPQGGRRLSAARSELSARAARLHAGRRRLPGAGDAIGAARPAARGLRSAPSGRAARRRLHRRSRAGPTPRRRSISIRATRPM